MKLTCAEAVQQKCIHPKNVHVCDVNRKVVVCGKFAAACKPACVFSQVQGREQQINLFKLINDLLYIKCY